MGVSIARSSSVELPLGPEMGMLAVAKPRAWPPDHMMECCGPGEALRRDRALGAGSLTVSGVPRCSSTASFASATAMAIRHGSGKSISHLPVAIRPATVAPTPIAPASCSERGKSSATPHGAARELANAPERAAGAALLRPALRTWRGKPPPAALAPTARRQSCAQCAKVRFGGRQPPLLPSERAFRGEEARRTSCPACPHPGLRDAGGRARTRRNAGCCGASAVQWGRRGGVYRCRPAPKHGLGETWRHA